MHKFNIPSINSVATFILGKVTVRALESALSLLAYSGVLNTTEGSVVAAFPDLAHMSFGELASLPHSADSDPPSVASAANELRGHLRALAANSASLRQWESAEDAAEELRRVRALRSQNRDLVRNSVALLGRLESAADEDDADPKLRAEADDLRELLRERIEDFSDALRESIARERDAVAVADPGSAAADVSVLPELGASRAPLSSSQAREDAPLLAVADERETALRRELASTVELREQRVAALREIHTSVADVNDIMLDLASMIGDQATSLEFVAVNVEESFQSTAAAKRQLIRARKSREQKRRLFFLALAVVALVIALLLVVLLT